MTLIVLTRPWNLKTYTVCPDSETPDSETNMEKVAGHQLSLVMRNPVFWVSDQVRLKPPCSATETS